MRFYTHTLTHPILQATLFILQYTVDTLQYITGSSHYKVQGSASLYGHTTHCVDDLLNQ